MKPIGVPLALVNDEGSDLVKGAELFQSQHPETRRLNDMAHKTAVLLKRELLTDPRWAAFTKHCGQTQQAIKNCGLEYLRVEGYHASAASELGPQLLAVARTAAGHRMAASLTEFVREQSQGAQPGQSLPASSEVLESLIGKGKRLQGQHSRGGFTKMVLGMAASVVELTHERICQALDGVRHTELFTWRQQTLGPSLASQRRIALPAIMTGTKTEPS